MNSANAFNPSYPCPSEWFVGRLSQIRCFEGIASRLAAGKENQRAILVQGPTGIGKSSLLREMQIVAKKHSCEMYICTPTSEMSLNFFGSVLQDLVKMTLGEKTEEIVSTSGSSRKLQLTASDLALGIPSAKEEQEALLARYRQLFLGLNPDLEKNNTGFLIFIDQAERLLHNDAPVAYGCLETLVVLLRTYCRRIMLGISLAPSYVVELLQKCPELSQLSYTSEFQLEALSDHEALDLVQTRVQTAGMEISPSVGKKLVNLSGRVPYKLVSNLSIAVGSAEELGVKTVDDVVLDRATSLIESSSRARTTAAMGLLKELGLTEYEARIFYTLHVFMPIVSTRGISIEEISRYSEVTLAKCTKILETLKERGLVFEVRNRSGFFELSDRAVQLLYDTVSQQANEEEMTRLRATVSSLEEVLAKSVKPVFWREYRHIPILHELVDHAERIREERKMLGEAKRGIKILVRTFSRFGDFEQDLGEKAHQIDIKILMQIHTEENVELAKRFEQMGMKVRHWKSWLDGGNWIPTRWITVDEKIAIWHKWNMEGDFIEWAFRISDPSVVEILDYIFDTIWNNSIYSISLREQLESLNGKRDDAY